MRLPINVVVTRPAAHEQKPVIEAARQLKVPPERVAFEESDRGLVVHGLTEFDIESTVFELRKSVPELQHGKPQVAYDLGPPPMEPYYRATVEVPTDNLGAVMGDMSSRRGLIQRTRESAIGMEFVAELPVSECFGYGTTLRALTQGIGRYTVEYAGYRPFPRVDRGPGDAA